MEQGNRLRRYTPFALGLTVLALSLSLSVWYVVRTLPGKATLADDFGKSGDYVPSANEITAKATVMDSTPGGEVVTVFNDYQCSACKALHDTLDALRRRGNAQIGIRIIHFPLGQLHPRAFQAAVAFACAAKFGEAARAHHQLFAATEPLTTLRIRAAAVEGIGDLRRDSVRLCIERADTRDVVRSDIRLATNLRLRGTPAMIIGGRLWYGAISGDSLMVLLRLSHERR